MFLVNCPLMDFMSLQSHNAHACKPKMARSKLWAFPGQRVIRIALGDAHLFKSTWQITEYISKAVNAIIQDLAEKLNPKSLPSLLPILRSAVAYFLDQKNGQSMAPILFLCLPILHVKNLIM